MPHHETLTAPAGIDVPPPADGGVWTLLIGDTFDERGPGQIWTRPNPLWPSAYSPSDEPLPNRLAIHLTPQLDLVAARDREILVAADPLNDGALLIIPVALARIDASFVAALRDSRTIAELRLHEIAWSVAAAAFDEQALDAQEAAGSWDLDGDTPFDPSAWFGDEALTAVIPEARLRTVQSAPMCLNDLAREDHATGVDYLPAPWWAADDLVLVERQLRARHFHVSADAELAAGYSW